MPAVMSIHARLLDIAEHRFQRRLRAQHKALQHEREKAAVLQRCEQHGQAMLGQRASTQQALLNQASARDIHALRIVKLRAAITAGAEATHLAVGVLAQAEAELASAQGVTRVALKRVKKLEKLSEMLNKHVHEE